MPRPGRLTGAGGSAAGAAFVILPPVSGGGGVFPSRSASPLYICDTVLGSSLGSSGPGRVVSGPQLLDKVLFAPKVIELLEVFEVTNE